MIFISKLFTFFLLPPGCIILGLLVIIFFVPRKIKPFLGLVTALLYLMSIRPIADFLLLPLEDAYPPLQTALLNQGEGELQAIVVLGGGTVLGSPEAGGYDTLAPDAMKRALYAFTLRDDFPVPFVFSGGIVFDYGQDSEAEVTGRLFADLGLPPQRFILESASRNTWENARETAKLGITQVIMVTSAYHIKRSVYCFERNGITVIPAPTDYKCNRGQKHDFFSFVPSMWSLNKTWMALHEYIGLLYYRLVYR